MQNLLRGGGRPSVLAVSVVATIAAAMVALPGAASAQNTLSLSLEPTVPREGQPFQIIARGTAQDGSGGNWNTVDYGFGPGSGPCASTSALEGANGTIVYTDFGIPDGPFDVRRVFRGSGGNLPDSATVNNGLVTGHYRACGYLYGTDSHSGLPPAAPARLEFTVGGTCDTATNARQNARQNLRQARRGLKRARRGLRQARRTGTRVKRARRNVRQARTRVKRARNNLRRAQSRVAALC